MHQRIQARERLRVAEYAGGERLTVDGAGLVQDAGAEIADDVVVRLAAGLDDLMPNVIRANRGSRAAPIPRPRMSCRRPVRPVSPTLNIGNRVRRRPRYSP